MMTNIPEWQEYCDLVEPDVELLKTLLETNSDKLDDPITRKAVERKYHSLVYEPTIVEKTMTPEQLFTSGHPLWEKPYTINEIAFVLRSMHACTCYEEIFAPTEKHRDKPGQNGVTGIFCWHVPTT